LTLPSLWNTLSSFCCEYFSINKSDVTRTLGLLQRLWLVFQTPGSGLFGLIILARGISKMITFFPRVDSAWLVCTKTLFLESLSCSGSLGTNRCLAILVPSPNVNRPSFKADCTYRLKYMHSLVVCENVPCHLQYFPLAIWPGSGITCSSLKHMTLFCKRTSNNLSHLDTSKVNFTSSFLPGLDLSKEHDNGLSRGVSTHSTM
jgi:hypothetical protein